MPSELHFRMLAGRLYVFFVDCIGDVATQDLHTGVFQFHIGKTAKKYVLGKDM